MYHNFQPNIYFRKDIVNHGMQNVNPVTPYRASANKMPYLLMFLMIFRRNTSVVPNTVFVTFEQITKLQIESFTCPYSCFLLNSINSAIIMTKALNTKLWQSAND